MVRPASYFREGYSRLCLWGANLQNTGFVWGKLESMLPENLMHHVGKVARIFQSNGVLRFDVYVEAAHLKEVLEVISKGSQPLGWHLREHIGNPLDRPMSGSDEHQQPVRKVLLRLATWNIQGIRNKRADIDMLASESSSLGS